MYRSISIDEFYQKNKTESLNIIDVREVDEYIKGHIPNSKNHPLSNIEQEKNKFSKSKEYYIICQSGNRSSIVSKYLGELGFDVVNVMGGMSSWKGDIE